MDALKLELLQSVRGNVAFAEEAMDRILANGDEVLVAHDATRARAAADAFRQCMCELAEDVAKRGTAAKKRLHEQNIREQKDVIIEALRRGTAANIFVARGEAELAKSSKAALARVVAKVERDSRGMTPHAHSVLLTKAVQFAEYWERRKRAATTARWLRVRCVVRMMLQIHQARERSYRPCAAGYERARVEFEGLAS